MALPSTYQEVEWIQSSGTQYINTGFIPNNNTKIEFSMGGWQSQPEEYCDLFGARLAWSSSASSGRGFHLGHRQGSQTRVYYGMFGGYILNIPESYLHFIDGGNYVYEMSSSGIYENGTYAYATSAATFTSPVAMVLFGLNDNGTVASLSKFKVYYCKIWNNGTLVRDFVPCYRKSDSVIGLYDLVNNTFYTNAGSGTFTKGPNVVEIKNIYLGSTKLSKIYVGSSEVKSVYVGTTMVWGGNSGWTPGANTLIYYPLTSNLVDQMGNGSTGTATGTVTFNASAGSTTGCHVTGTSGNYVTGMSVGINNRTTFTLNVWVRYDSGNSYGCIIGYSGTSQTNQCFSIDKYSSTGTNGRIRLLGTITSPVSGTNAGIFDDGPALGTWANYCITMNNGLCKMYINGQNRNVSIGGGTYYSSATFSSVNNVSELQLGWGGAYGSGRSGDGYIRDYIVETVAWSDAEIANYYNQTKSNYGL